MNSIFFRRKTEFVLAVYMEGIRFLDALFGTGIVGVCIGCGLMLGVGCGNNRALSVVGLVVSCTGLVMTLIAAIVAKSASE